MVFEWRTADYSRKVIQTKFFGALVRNFCPCAKVYLCKVCFTSQNSYRKSRKIHVPVSFLVKLQASGLQSNLKSLWHKCFPVNFAIQWRIQNPVKDLRWRFLRKQLNVFSQKARLRHLQGSENTLYRSLLGFCSKHIQLFSNNCFTDFTN